MGSEGRWGIPWCVDPSSIPVPYLVQDPVQGLTTTTEVKILKARVRDLLDPQRDLGHTDRAIRQDAQGGEAKARATDTGMGTDKDTDKHKACEDCQ